MAIIKKKAWPELFEQVLQGKKTFDLRMADFEIKEGDTLILEEYNSATETYTGRTIEKKVGYVLKFEADKLPFYSAEAIKEKGLQIISLL